MPDHIDKKGEALGLMGAYCFERLEEKCVRTHYKGLVEETEKPSLFNELKQPSNVMEVCLVSVYRPEHAWLKTENSHTTTAPTHLT